jgi:hypothetical protein
MLEFVSLLVAALGAAFRTRTDLVVENMLLRHQLLALTRPTRKRPRPRRRDRLVWVLMRSLRRDWRRYLVFVQPETVVRWHRRGWRLFWRWTSRARLGRPRVSPDIRELIATMAREPHLGRRAHPRRVAEAGNLGLVSYDGREHLRADARENASR